MDSIEFFNNTNSKGSSCISGEMSTVKLVNVSAVGNVGKGGGLLNMTTSEVIVTGSAFQSNIGIAHPDSTGGTLLLTDSNLTVIETEFIENKSSDLGGTVFVEVCNENFTNIQYSVISVLPFQSL